MAVRVVLPEGETVFTYATSAVSRGPHVAVFAWDAAKNSLDEVAVFEKAKVVSVEVLNGASVMEKIRGYAASRGPAPESGSP